MSSIPHSVLSRDWMYETKMSSLESSYPCKYRSKQKATRIMFCWLKRPRKKINDAHTTVRSTCEIIKALCLSRCHDELIHLRPARCEIINISICYRPIICGDLTSSNIFLFQVHKSRSYYSLRFYDQLSLNCHCRKVRVLSY
jgi:hypothetical protein